MSERQVVCLVHLLRGPAVHVYHIVPLQRAICEAYGVVVNVITSDQQHWFMRYEPEGTQPKKSVEVFVTYIAPIHYNAVRYVATDHCCMSSQCEPGEQ